MYNNNSAFIILKCTDGFKYIYVRDNGAPNRPGYLADILLSYYNNVERVEELISHGVAVRISKNIDPDIHRNHTKDDPQKDVCLFYGRDIEFTREPTRYCDVELKEDELCYKFAESEETIYENAYYSDWLYMFKEGKWYIKGPCDTEYKDLQTVYQEYIDSGAEGYYPMGDTYYIKKEEIQRVTVIGDPYHNNKDRGLLVTTKKGHTMLLYFPTAATYNTGHGQYYTYDGQLFTKGTSIVTGIEFSRYENSPSEYFNKTKFFGRVKHICFYIDENEEYTHRVRYSVLFKRCVDNTKGIQLEFEYASYIPG